VACPTLSDSREAAGVDRPAFDVGEHAALIPTSCGSNPIPNGGTYAGRYVGAVPTRQPTQGDGLIEQEHE